MTNNDFELKWFRLLMRIHLIKLKILFSREWVCFDSLGAYCKQSTATVTPNSNLVTADQFQSLFTEFLSTTTLEYYF